MRSYIRNIFFNDIKIKEIISLLFFGGKMAELIPKQQRQVAIICCVKDILEGEYKREEGWLPNYVLTKSNYKVSRANMIGVVVEVNLF